MGATFFPTPAAFRKWLHKHHKTADELLVGFYRKDSGRPSITWPESVDEALCFGWIDGIRRRIDEESYSIRFTPRRRGSTWSAINIGRVKVLKAEGRMQPAGLAAYAGRTSEKSATYAYEQRKTAVLSAAQERRLRATPRAWAYFKALPPSHRHLMAWWVTSAKQDATRERRLARLIAACAEGRRL